MNEALREAANSQVFLKPTAPYVLLDRELRIVSANAAHLMATAREADTVINEFVFDAFPGDPADPAGDGVARLGDSFRTVLERGVTHNMILQRYPIPSSNGEFTERVWSPVNSPITDNEDRVVGILHHVEDVSQVLKPVAVGLAPLPSRALDALTGAARLVAAQDTVISHNRQLQEALAALALAGHPLSDDEWQLRRHLWSSLVDRVLRSDTEGWAHSLCTIAAADVGPRVSVAVTVAGRDLPDLVASSGPTADLVEELQYTVGEGPSVHATKLGLPVAVADISVETGRWPLFVPHAIDLGVRGCMVQPVLVAGTVIGTLGFYAFDTDPVADPQQTRRLADIAGAALVIDVYKLREDIYRSRDAPSPYGDISIAVGLLQAWWGISATDARARLRSHAFANRQSLRALAKQIINGDITLDPWDDHDWPNR